MIDGLVARGMAVAVVGHEPTLAMLGAMVMGRPAFPAFRTAQCAALDRGVPTFTSRADVMTTTALFVD